MRHFGVGLFSALNNNAHFVMMFFGAYYQWLVELCVCVCVSVLESVCCVVCSVLPRK